MFTGIITELGVITKVSITPEGARFSIRAPLTVVELKKGDSVAINGACHTVLKITTDSFEVLSMLETLERTTMGLLREGGTVNLERPVLSGQRLDGHMVQGHVDAVVAVTEIKPRGMSHSVRERRDMQTEYTFSVDPKHTRYIVEKGSIAVNGVSLTITKVSEGSFSVAVIPHTKEHTTFKDLVVGTRVNVELDQTLKALEKLLTPSKQSSSLQPAVLHVTQSVIEGSRDGSGLSIAIILPRFNEHIGQEVLKLCLATLIEHGVAEQSIEIVRVPGAFEIPVTARALVKKNRYDALIALGCVIRGETTHYDQICETVTQQISSISNETGIPVIHGILTTETLEQAQARIERGKDSALAAIEMATLLQQLTTNDQRLTTLRTWNLSRKH